MDARRRILFNLTPETSGADNYVCDEIEKVPQGERGKLFRATMLAGFALRKQDPRLPNLLAELLDEKTSFDDIINILRVIYPQQINAMMNSGELSQSNSGISCTDNNPVKEPQPDAITRDNARKLF